MDDMVSARVVALVGMPGSGKSEAAAIFVRKGFKRIRFGELTDEAIRQQGLELNEDNERRAREDLRKRHGMAAYAMLSLPRIQAGLKETDIVIDGLYSWEEYKYLKESLGVNLVIVAVWSPPSLRYKRLQERRVRPLTMEQARSRDYAEIENINKGGPIAMADYMIINDSTMDSLVTQAEKIIRLIK